MPVWDSWLYVSSFQGLYARASFSVAFLLSAADHSGLKPQLYSVLSMTLEADGDSFMKCFVGLALCPELLGDIGFTAKPESSMIHSISVRRVFALQDPNTKVRNLKYEIRNTKYEVSDANKRYGKRQVAHVTKPSEVLSLGTLHNLRTICDMVAGLRCDLRHY
jgi:hypothetical protein